MKLTIEEIQAVENRVIELQQRKQREFESDCKNLKAKWRNVNSIKGRGYSVKMLFEDLKIDFLESYFSNMKSRRPGFLSRNESFNKLCKAIGIYIDS